MSRPSERVGEKTNAASRAGAGAVLRSCRRVFCCLKRGRVQRSDRGRGFPLLQVSVLDL